MDGKTARRVRAIDKRLNGDLIASCRIDLRLSSLDLSTSLMLFQINNTARLSAFLVCFNITEMYFSKRCRPDQSGLACILNTGIQTAVYLCFIYQVTAEFCKQITVNLTRVFPEVFQ